MKKQFLFMALMLSTVISALAFEDGSCELKSKSLNLEQSYTSVSAKGNIEVVLVPTNSTEINIEGNEKFIDAVRFNVSKGVLHIAGVNGRTKDRVTVYVPVNDLKVVTLRNGTNLSSKGRLSNKKLNVKVEGISVVNLKSSGEIIIDGDDNYLFNYEKIERSTIRVEKA